MKDDKLRSEIETCVIDPEHSDVEHCAVESKENSTHLNKNKIKTNVSLSHNYLTLDLKDGFVFAFQSVILDF